MNISVQLCWCWYVCEGWAANVKHYNDKVVSLRVMLWYGNVQCLPSLAVKYTFEKVPNWYGPRLVVQFGMILTALYSIGLSHNFSGIVGKVILTWGDTALTPEWWLQMAWFEIIARKSAIIMMTLLWLLGNVNHIMQNVYYTLCRWKSYARMNLGSATLCVLLCYSWVWFLTVITLNYSYSASTLHTWRVIADRPSLK